jgi:hypothetical protein
MKVIIVWNFYHCDEFILSQEYSISSRRNPVGRRRGPRSLRRPEHDEKVAQYFENHFNFIPFSSLSHHNRTVIMIFHSICLIGFTFSGRNTNTSVNIVEESFREYEYTKCNEYFEAPQKGRNFCPRILLIVYSYIMQL